MVRLNSAEKLDLLKNVSIFSGTKGEVLGMLAEALTEIGVKTGSTIIRKGEQGDAMYIIVSGEVRIHDGNHLIAKMTSGNVFGDYTLMDDAPRSASVTAETEGLLLRLSREDFYTIAAGNKDVLRGVMLTLLQRIREMNVLEEKLSKSYLKIRRQKEQIEKQNENISRQKEQLSQQNYDLTRLNEEKNHLISLVMHQIKNPLTSSLCMIEMLQADSSLSAGNAESLEVARKSLRRINNLLNEFLDVNAIDSKVFKLKMETLDLSEIIRELCLNYQYSIEQKNITLVTGIKTVAAKMNRVYFTQIVDNLLSNAVKYTVPGGRIEIGLKEDGERIEFSIRDEGPGMEQETLDEIFSQYRRQVDMEIQHLPPEGLGLAIVQRYTRAMNGDVECLTEKGKGTTFLLTFQK